MTPNARAYIVLQNGSSVTLDKPLSFTFKKDRYSPTQEFTGEFYTDRLISSPKTVNVYIKGYLVINGFVQSIKTVKSGTGYICRLTAKSKTSLLEQNHIRPDLYTQTSLRKFYDDYIKIPDINFSGGLDYVNYVNFSDNASMWDAIVLICLKLYGVYPYTLINNQIMFSMPSVQQELSLSASRIVSAEEKLDTSRLISHVYMKDLDGNYAAYSKESPYAKALGITREKHIPILYSWVHDIDAGLSYKLNFARRKCHEYKISYLGYFSEDLYYKLIIPSGIFNYNTYYIHGIEIKGDDKKVVTTLSSYDDYYSVIAGK